jgi:Zn-dependent protease with chaperone function
VEAPELYPPSPAELPGATKTTGSYRLRVVFVLLSLTTFLVLYLGLITATAYALYALFTGQWGDGGLAIFWGSGLALLLVFLVKNLFRRSRASTGDRIEVTEQEQPRLFAFLRRLCAEARCRFPGAVYLSPDVNAAVYYPRSVLSLLIPRRKNLLIGLGLVNALNVSELKAVLAHEFGHFSQSSMKLGQYVYVANEVVRDIVFTRDTWDELLAKWRSINIRLSFPAWVLTGVLWAIRALLKQLYKLVNFANLSLSRQMEFDADLRAAALVGSDALVSALWKSERAGLAFSGACQTLSSLLGYEKYSDDLFHHQRCAEKRLDQALASDNQPTPFVLSLRSKYRPGPEPHFQRGDDHSPSMWATHPSNRERELNVKRKYVACEPLEASAWRLFDGRKALKQRLTLVSYQTLFEREVDASACLPAKRIEALVRAERDELRQAPHYHGFYENRIVDPGRIKTHTVEIDAWPAGMRAELRAGLRAIVDEWTGPKLAAYAAELASCSSPERAKTLRERIPRADAAIFRYFYACSLDDGEARAELLQRYGFLLAMQKHITTLNEAERIFVHTVEWLKQANGLTPEDFRQVQAAFVDVHERLATVRAKAIKQRLPKLEHLEQGTSVRDFIGDVVLGDAMSGDRIATQEIANLERVLQTTLSRLRRLHLKNLGSLLRLQESLDPTLYANHAPTPKAEAGIPGDEETDEDDVA